MGGKPPKYTPKYTPPLSSFNKTTSESKLNEKINIIKDKNINNNNNTELKKLMCELYVKENKIFSIRKKEIKKEIIKKLFEIIDNNITFIKESQEISKNNPENIIKYNCENINLIDNYGSNYYFNDTLIKIFELLKIMLNTDIGVKMFIAYKEINEEFVVNNIKYDIWDELIKFFNIIFIDEKTLNISGNKINSKNIDEDNNIFNFVYYFIEEKIKTNNLNIINTHFKEEIEKHMNIIHLKKYE